jgi:hypothetical protein
LSWVHYPARTIAAVKEKEFDVEEGASPDVIGVAFRDASFPRDSKVAAIIRGDGLRAVATGNRVTVEVP